jgi:hypothetical protein
MLLLRIAFSLMLSYLTLPRYLREAVLEQVVAQALDD